MKHLLQIFLASLLIVGSVFSGADAKVSSNAYQVTPIPPLRADKLFCFDGISAAVPEKKNHQGSNTQEDNQTQAPDSQGDATIKPEQIYIYNTKTQSRLCIDLTEYLVGVLAAEMPASYSLEALKAQAVAARTYLYYKMGKGGCARYEPNCACCTFSGHCQGYLSKNERRTRWGEQFAKYEQKLLDAVEQTAHECLFYNGKIVNAMYHSSSAVSTEDYHSLYGTDRVEYLQSVSTPDNKADITTTKEMKVAEFINAFKNYPNNGLTLVNVKDEVYISSYTDGARADKVRVGYYELSGVEFKNLFSLRSTHFEITATPRKVVITCYGHGHGIGMSQLGANVMALNGKNYKEILLHYYRGTAVKQCHFSDFDAYLEKSQK